MLCSVRNTARVLVVNIGQSCWILGLAVQRSFCKKGNRGLYVNDTSHPNIRGNSTVKPVLKEREGHYLLRGDTFFTVLLPYT
jgi:hypothetical protein